MPKWGIFNASVLFTEHGHLFLFENGSSHIINIQRTKFERKSFLTFISEELPQMDLIRYLLMTRNKYKLNSFGYAQFVYTQHSSLFVTGYHTLVA